MATERFANNTTTTVSSGGTSAPAGGTVETWTVASSASFPAASSTLGTQFHVVDIASPAEKIRVTNVSGTTWTVVRGAESSTPAAHNAGFTIVQVVTAGGLASFLQAKPWQFFVDDPTYGAVGDGKVVNDVVTNSTTTITSATAAFTSADVGKTVMINGANGTTSAPLVTTIAGFTNSTTVTLANAAGVTTTGCQMVWGTNDQTAIQSAIDAAGTYALANNFFAEVVFGNKIYMLTAAPGQSGNGTSTPTYNTQLKLPTSNANGLDRKLVIHLTGAANAGYIQYWISTKPNIAGTALVSTRTAPSTPDSTFGNQSVIGGPSAAAGFTGGFSNTKAVIKNMQVVAGVYTNLYAFDLGYLSAARVEASSAIGFAPSTAGTQPRLTDLPSQLAYQSTIGVGFRFPVGGNNADPTADEITVAGFARSYWIWDHFTAGRMFSFYSDVAVRLDSTFGVGGGVNHLISIQNFNAEAYNGGILFNGGNWTLDINLDAEVAAPAYDINGGSGVVGILHFTDPATARNISVTGCGNLKIVDDNLKVRGFWSAAPSIPATGVATTPIFRDAAVMIAGGTVSAIAVDGQTLGVTSGMITVPSGKTLTVTYSVTPTTYKWFLT